MGNWRPIKGFDGYEVSDTGQVRSWKRLRNYAPIPTAPRLLSISRDRNGYARVVLYKNGKPTYHRVPVLVAGAWVGDRRQGQVVRHLDGSKDNDCAANLAWGTPKENSADSIRHGTMRSGSAVNTSRLSEESVIEILESKDPHVSLAKKYGVTPCAIWHIRAGRTWKHIKRSMGFESGQLR